VQPQPTAAVSSSLDVAAVNQRLLDIACNIDFPVELDLDVFKASCTIDTRWHRTRGLGGSAYLHEMLDVARSSSSSSSAAFIPNAIKLVQQDVVAVS
jgi:hypothetical protein